MIRLFNASIAPATFILLLFESLLLLGALVLATVVVADVDPVDYLLYDSGLIALLLVVLGFLLGLHFQDLYTDIRVKSNLFLVQQLSMVTGVAFLAEGLISSLNSDLRVSVRVMLLASAIAVPSLFVERLVFSNFAGQPVPRTRLIIIGQNPDLGPIADLDRDATASRPRGGRSGRNTRRDERAGGYPKDAATAAPDLWGLG